MQKKYHSCPVRRKDFTEQALDLCHPKNRLSLPFPEVVLDRTLKMYPLAHFSPLSHISHALFHHFFVPGTMQPLSLFANWWQSGWGIHPPTPLIAGIGLFFLWWIRTTHPTRLSPIVLFIIDHFNKSYVISQCRPGDALQAVFKSAYLP